MILQVMGIARYTKRLALRSNRHVEPTQAVHDLLNSWNEGTVTARRDKSLALRLSTTRTHGVSTTEDDNREAREMASVPAVIDLLEARKNRKANELDLVDDLDDVFARYYKENPDQEGFEVFDE